MPTLSHATVDWRMLLVEADEIQHFKQRGGGHSAESILRALALHGLDRRAVETELGLARNVPG